MVSKVSLKVKRRVIFTLEKTVGKATYAAKKVTQIM